MDEAINVWERAPARLRPTGALIKMVRLSRWTTTLAVLFLVPAAHAHAQSVAFPDQDLSGFHFSGLILTPGEPALSCIVTGEAGVEATLDIDAYLFDAATPKYPYVNISNHNLVVSAGQHADCLLDNGPQSVAVGGKVPVWLELQVKVTRAVRTQIVTLPVPTQK